jgi:hypothetical protein
VQSYGPDARLVDAMRFDFLYDRRRRIFAIGYRLADADGAGRFDGAYYDLLASEARSPSFVADREGGRAAAPLVPPRAARDQPSGGHAALIYGAAPMFEYLMPQPPDAQLRRHVARPELPARRCKRQIDYGRQRGVPWGSRSRLRVHDRDGTYPYRGVRVPGLGLRACLGHGLCHCPVRDGTRQPGVARDAVENFERLAEAGVEGTYGFYESV